MLFTCGAYLVQGASFGSILSVGNIKGVLVYSLRMKFIEKVF